MSEIKIAIAGVGNCASSLIQGLFYYRERAADDAGLMHRVLGGYEIKDIAPVAAFDIDARKVGKDLSEAIFALPNNTLVFYKNVPKLNVVVKKGPVLDGVPEHMSEYPEDERFVISHERELTIKEVIDELKNSGADILLNYLPVGSQKATEFYANAALEARCGLVNCMPVFICSDEGWIKKFEARGLPCLGDDIKAQFGATIVHRALTKLASDRGVKILGTHQENYGGNTDFLNMEKKERLRCKKISKTEAVQSQLPVPLDRTQIHVGPAGYIPYLKDRKICDLYLEGQLFGGAPTRINVHLEVEDSPNSAGCVIDAIRLVKIGLDRKISGCLESGSAYLMKHPPKQYSDSEAREMVEEFIEGKRAR